MTASEEMAKHLIDRDVERKGAVELWGRSWKGDIVVRLKREHEAASDLMLDLLLARPDPSAGIDEQAAEYYRALDAASRAVDRLRERMAKLATTGQAGRPRKDRGGPIAEAELVSMPRPEVATAPESDPQPPG